jgi:hypothetical protein
MPAPKDFDNVLVRLPARVKQLVSETAHNEKVSQNALITSAVLSMMVAKDLRRMGYPENVLALVRAIDASVIDGFPIFGGMKKDDWNSAKSFLTMLADCDLIDGLASRVDQDMPDSVLFAMNLTKVGKLIWPDLSSWIQVTYSRKPSVEEELPLVHSR